MSEEIIISTKETPGDYDALETAKPGEPIFTLQGGDPLAPPCITLWSELCRHAALAESDDAKREALLKKATAAEAVAWAFDDYRKGVQPDPVAPTNAQGIPDSAEDLHSADMVRLARVLHNAIAEANNVAEALSNNPIPGYEHLALCIELACGTLRSAAFDIEPRRMMRETNRA